MLDVISTVCLVLMAGTLLSLFCLGIGFDYGMKHAEELRKRQEEAREWSRTFRPKNRITGYLPHEN